MKDLKCPNCGQALPFTGKFIGEAKIETCIQGWDCKLCDLPILKGVPVAFFYHQSLGSLIAHAQCFTNLLLKEKP